MNITNRSSKSVFAGHAVFLILFATAVVAAIYLANPSARADSNVAQANGSPQTQASKDQVAFDGSDLQLAGVAFAKSNYPLAMEHVSRQLDRSPGDGDALAFLTKCVRTISAQDCARGHQMGAEALLSQLSARVEAARQTRFQAIAPIAALDDLVDRNHDIQQIGDLITASADEQAAPHIDAAMRLADEAHYPWYTFRSNDRDKVREGLHELHWVHERGTALSNDTMCRYWQALDHLKARVADSEWPSLEQEAGFAKLEESR